MIKNSNKNKFLRRGNFLRKKKEHKGRFDKVNGHVVHLDFVHGHEVRLDEVHGFFQKIQWFDPDGA